ncbi:hypothetical protein A9267_07125 [Shewanella sp. UCD-FRSSP16_17]|uniref:DUF4365 domain-containing protein n=1 Tax=Shewanella sp. UCD-FRSSP16_17 TaxID=1853256 RepID=UPI0007EEE4BE|nr:DUF4365 domain-containing protein [Shewanella sp. UCD-FRSSP16_17]OBT10622.1 hypothetical protein A9267_07125 [Shewanella sp. UCD-FRSSP16_17]
MRDLGDLGELHFNAWCSEFGLIANKSTKDKMGWDYIVEFPFSNEITGLQVHQSAPKCKVQVKATDGQERKLSINLSNLHKLAIDPLPCFYIFIEYDGSNTPVRAFLRHMDEELIEKILQLVTTTNQKSYTLRYDESHLLKALTGESIAKNLKSYIGNLSQYINSKKSFLENVGFDEDRLKIRFDLIGKENLEDLIDVHIGIREKARISNVSAVEKRFGQSHEKTDFCSKSAELSLPVIEPIATAKLIFRKGSISKDYRFDVEVYLPTFLGHFDHPLFKSRYKTNFFDLTIKHNSKKINFNFNFGLRLFKLRNLRDNLKFISDVSSGNAYKILLKSEDGQEVLGSITSDAINVDYDNKIETLNTLIQINQLFNVGEEVLISFDEMEYLASSCSSILDFFGGNAERFKISFDVVDGKLNMDDEIVLLGAITYRIGDVILYALYSAEGKVITVADSDRDYAVQAPKVTIINRISINASSPIPVEDVYDELTSLEGNYGKRPVIILRE